MQIYRLSHKNRVIVYASFVYVYNIAAQFDLMAILSILYSNKNYRSYLRKLKYSLQKNVCLKNYFVDFIHFFQFLLIVLKEYTYNTGNERKWMTDKEIMHSIFFTFCFLFERSTFWSSTNQKEKKMLITLNMNHHIHMRNKEHYC